MTKYSRVTLEDPHSHAFVGDFFAVEVVPKNANMRRELPGFNI